MFDELESPVETQESPFTDDQSYLLPGLVGPAGRFADRRGPIGTMEEMVANARATAEAAKEVGVLGTGGVGVSDHEQQALDQIATALGVGWPVSLMSRRVVL